MGVDFYKISLQLNCTLHSVTTNIHSFVARCMLMLVCLTKSTLWHCSSGCVLGNDVEVQKVNKMGAS